MASLGLQLLKEAAKGLGQASHGREHLPSKPAQTRWSRLPGILCGKIARLFGPHRKWPCTRLAMSALAMGTTSWIGVRLLQEVARVCDIHLPKGCLHLPGCLAEQAQARAEVEAH